MPTTCAAIGSSGDSKIVAAPAYFCASLASCLKGVQGVVADQSVNETAEKTRSHAVLRRSTFAPVTACAF